MAGFEAYPAMTMAGSRVESIPADHFNHSVAVVKLSNGTYIPLDPTWVPFLRELWSSAEQQQNYLPGLAGRLRFTDYAGVRSRKPLFQIKYYVKSGQ